MSRLASDSAADEPYFQNLLFLDEYITKNEESPLDFVIQLRMYDDINHGHGAHETGTHALHTLQLPAYFTAYDPNAGYKRAAVMGDGQCAYRSTALRVVGDETGWSAPDGLSTCFYSFH